MPVSTLMLRHFCLALIVVQNSSLILVTSYSRTLTPAYLPSVAVCLSEVLKATLALLFLAWELGSPAAALRDTTSLLREHGHETMQFAVPALCYTLQNHLWYYALSHLDPVVAAVTSQMKVITTAIASVLMLSRRLTRTQWFSIVVLAVGMVVIQARNEAEGDRRNSLGGAGAMLLLFQYCSVLQNCASMQLSMFALPIATVCVGVYDFRAIASGEIMVGFNRWAWLAVVLNAIGGVAVSMALK
ncbi:MAG: hypothetical protein SGPRY_010357 [Prymnesium sp.]